MRILIAEDDVTSRSVLTAVLKKQGHEVVATVNGAEAWQALQHSDAPRLVILDWMMPELSGLDVCRRTRALNKSQPPYIIMLTTKGTKADLIAGLEAGADDYLAKPFDTGELYARVNVGERMLAVQAALGEKALELRKAGEQNRSLLESLSAGVVLHGLDTAIVYANATAATMLGMPPNQLPGQVASDPDWRFLQEDGTPLPPEEHPVNRVLSSNRSIGDLTLGVRPAGSAPLRWLLCNAYPMRDEGGSILQVVFTFVDITERKQHESALREAESRYRRLFETARDGILILEAESGRIVDLNPHLIALLGYPRDYFLNHVLWEIPLFKDVTLSKNAFAELRETERIACEDLPLETRDGRPIEVEFVSHAYQAGATQFVQCNVRDVTGRNTALNHLRELNEMQAKFVAEASHEIRTPLTIIKESVLQVLDGLCGELNPDQKEILTLCMQGIERLRAVVNDLMDISKLEAGKTVLMRDSVSMPQLLNEIRVAFLSQARAKNLALEVVDSPCEVWASLDRGRMLQVLTNLVGNAIKFTDRGHVRLSVCDKGNELECSVADTGVGIAEADLPKVFGRFLQFGTSYTGPGGGTGLGLSIAKSLVELHGGKIRVESALNQGTVFTFTVPKLTETEVLTERMATVVARAKQENKEIMAVLMRIEDDSSSPPAATEGKPSDSVRATVEKLEEAIRRKGFTPIRGKDGLLILAEAGGERAAEINALLRQTAKQCVFERDERLHTSLDYGWSLYPRDGATPQALLEKTRESLAADKQAQAEKNILIVDDDPQIVALLHSTLARLGYGNVTSANDGCEALEKTAASIPALIILDMNMPNMNGYEFMGRMKHTSRTARVPLLILTGYAVETERVMAQGGPEAIPTLAKPVGIDTLCKWVRLLII
ncbi:MAG: response regulator [Kiritimatiellia bacterium]